MIFWVLFFGRSKASYRSISCLTGKDQKENSQERKSTKKRNQHGKYMHFGLSPSRLRIDGLTVGGKGVMVIFPRGVEHVGD